MLVGRARLIVGAEDAEDVVQSVWMKLSASGWRGDCAIGSWLYLMTTSAAISHLRSRKAKGRDRAVSASDPSVTALTGRRRRRKGDEQEQPLHNVPSEAPSPEDYAVAGERAAAIRERLGRLSRRERKVLLDAVRGRTRLESALRRQTNLNTIKTRLKRARRKLR
jgi:RNA polymerase sigma factor (sigma-70 family)